MKKTTSGFTIVELLIVIVVIAILAAISVVAYTGIQNRATNAQVVSGVSIYLKAFGQYKAVYETYPAEDGCLGAGYPDGRCWQGVPDRDVNSALDSRLSEFLTVKPTLATGRMQMGDTANHRAGLAWIPDDATYGNRLTFYLKGRNQDCIIAGAQASSEYDLTQCNVSLQ